MFKTEKEKFDSQDRFHSYFSFNNSMNIPPAHNPNLQ